MESEEGERRPEKSSLRHEKKRSHEKGSVGVTKVLPQEFLEKLESLGSVEEKLEHLLHFMQEFLQDGKGHHFREFWEARQLCSELFVQNMHPLMRERLWARYTDLCHEAKGLKNLFDEQSAFFAEQIEKAIESVEQELPLFQEKGKTLPSIPTLLACSSIEKHIPRYEALYHELQFLNSFASRIASLRKELMKTEMRFKQKHRLLDRLTALGDSVFPKRKQAISEVSALFLDDVESFIQSKMLQGLKPSALFEVQEEIKRLQGIAKTLTLGTDAFSKVRERLSQCWDTIKEILAERRKAENQRREGFKKHREEVLQDIAKIEAEIEGKKISASEGKKALEALSSKMKETPLAYADVQMLREKFRELEGKVSHPAIHQSKETSSQEMWHQSFLQRLKGPCEGEEAFYALSQEAQKHPLSQTRRLEIDTELSRLRDDVEQACFKEAERLQGDALEQAIFSLEDLQEDCKQAIESWKKDTSGSTTDFTLAMRYIDLIETEKKRIVRIEQTIEKLAENDVRSS